MGTAFSSRSTTRCDIGKLVSPQFHIYIELLRTAVILNSLLVWRLAFGIGKFEYARIIMLQNARNVWKGLDWGGGRRQWCHARTPNI